MNIRLKLMKFIQKYFGRFVPNDYFNRILAMEGFSIGKGTIFYSPNTITIDRERPWMLKIGEYCKITRGCVILTHDYSRSVLRRKYGEIIGEAGITSIGDNVFIGMNSIILMGTRIGNNVIIGAGSVVSGIIPDDVVVAGNPAKIIRTLDSHYEKRKSKTLEEAKIYYNAYKEKYGSFPDEQFNSPFFSLYSDRNNLDYLNDSRFSLNGDDRNDVIKDFKKIKPAFDSYNSFVKFVIDEESSCNS